jgi:hypothetical protein
MISNRTGSIDRKVIPCRFKASADYWLSLAAAPTFAVMALLTGVLGGGQPDILCSAADRTLPLSGMVPMWLLMSVFHSQPWLKLISSRRKRCPPGVIRPRSNVPVMLSSRAGSTSAAVCNGAGACSPTLLDSA